MFDVFLHQLVSYHTFFHNFCVIVSYVFLTIFFCHLSVCHYLAVLILIAYNSRKLHNRQVGPF